MINVLPGELPSDWLESLTAQQGGHLSWDLRSRSGPLFQQCPCAAAAGKLRLVRSGLRKRAGHHRIPAGVRGAAAAAPWVLPFLCPCPCPPAPVQGTPAPLAECLPP